MIEIKRVENGFIATRRENNGEEDIVKAEVFEFGDEDVSELKAFRRLSCYLMEHLWIPDSKHNEYRLSINIKKNDR